MTSLAGSSPWTVVRLESPVHAIPRRHEDLDSSENLDKERLMEISGVFLLIGFPVGPILLGIYAWQRTKGTSGAGTGVPVPVWPGGLNASLAFALAFNLIYFVQEFFLAWPKALLPGVEAVVFHNNHNWIGDHPDVVMYQGAGALAIIFLGALLTLIGILIAKRLRGAYPMLWWSAALALGLGLIQVPIAAMHPDNDVGQAMDFLQLSLIVRDALAFSTVAAAITFGIYFVRPLLAMAPTGAVETARARVIYVLKFALIPLIAGSIIAWANRAPPMGHLTMPLFSGLFILPWSLAAAALTPTPKPVTDRLHRGVDWALIAVSVVVLLLFRLVLAEGLNV
jgi:hypothetical protein